MTPVRVVIVDDQELFVRGVVALFESDDSALGIEVVDTVFDPTAAVGRIRTTRPDVAVIDLNMEPLGGHAVIRDLRATADDPRVLVLTGSRDAADLARALEAGADSCVPKDVDATTLAHALHLTARGLQVLPGWLRETLPTLDPRSGELDGLSPDDIALFRLIATGATYDEIAGTLHVSARTARRQVKDLLTVLGVDNRIAAAELAGRLRLLGDSPPAC